MFREEKIKEEKEPILGG